MIGTTLQNIRKHIEALASDSGEYFLVCGRYGDQPVPAAGLRFESRPTARAAARATEQYRAALRRYDPQLPYYDVIVCQETTCTLSDKEAPNRSDERSDNPCPDAEASGLESGGQSLIDFCHTVAGAVFETVAASEYDTVERAIMDTYLTAAETIGSPDELCLRLLESMGTELNRCLTPDEQALLLGTAAARLSQPATDGDPLDASLSRLCSVALVTDYTLGPCSVDLNEDLQSWDVTLSGYALSRTGDRLTTLPIVIDLLRRRPDPVLSISRAEYTDGERPTSMWSFRLTAATAGEPTGLVCSPEVSTR